jgi:Protein of unknown function (DUF2752)
MRLVLRPLAPRETNHELLWLSISSGAFVVGAAWLRLHLSWPLCVFHEITGQPCPTCGATRAAIALLHGNVGAAWHLNPLAFICYCVLLLCNAYALWVLSTGAGCLRIVQITPTEKNVLRGFAATLVLANWIYLLMANPR